MNKKLLKLISKYIDNNNPKNELNYVLFNFDEGVIVATDTRQLIKVFIDPEIIHSCSGKHLMNKKIFKSVEQICTNDSIVKFLKNDIVIDSTSINLNNFVGKFDYPDYNRIIDDINGKSFNLSIIDFLDFELTHVNTHIDSSRLLPIMECDYPDEFNVEFIPQNGNNVATAIVRGYKIGKFDRENVYVSVFSGVLFAPSNPSLFDF